MRAPAVRRVLIVAVVFLTACSSDDDAGSSTTAAAATATTTTSTSAASSAGTGAPLDHQRQAIVTRLIADSATGGYELDEDCVKTLVEGLSESDVGILATSATDPSGDPPASDLSADAETMDILSCAVGTDDESLVAQAAGVAIAVVSADTIQRFDRECVEREFAKLTDEQLTAVVAAEEAPTQEALQPVLYLMVPCLLDGSSATSSS